MFFGRPNRLDVYFMTGRRNVEVVIKHSLDVSHRSAAIYGGVRLASLPSRL
jgi:hypothetical protein